MSSYRSSRVDARRADRRNWSTFWRAILLSQR